MRTLQHKIFAESKSIDIFDRQTKNGIKYFNGLEQNSKNPSIEELSEQSKYICECINAIIENINEKGKLNFVATMRLLREIQDFINQCALLSKNGYTLECLLTVIIALGKLNTLYFDTEDEQVNQFWNIVELLSNNYQGVYIGALEQFV